MSVADSCLSRQRNGGLRLRVAVIAALSLLLGRAWAAWTVEALWEADARGEMRAVERSGEAVARRGEVEEVLAQGRVLEAGIVVVTGAARVRLRAEGGDQVLIEPESEVELGEPGLLQRLGEALYEVRGAFRVRYGRVEAAVDGTRFAVDAGAGVIRVASGRVRVREGEVEAVVAAGEEARGTAVRPIEKAHRAAILRRSLGLGEPVWTAGLSARGGVGRAGVGAVVRRHLGGGWAASAETALSSTGERWFLPLSVGLDRRFGPLSAGAAALALAGPRESCEGERSFALVPGAAATARVSLPVRALRFEGSARAGWANGPVADLGLGVLVDW